MKTFKFYGVCENCYKLDNVVWEAVEDPSDGYRSYLGSIEIAHNTEDLIFFPDPVAEVYVKPDGEGGLGFSLVDVKDGHVWLVVGTEDYDHYYPCFIFRYSPKFGYEDPKDKRTPWEKFIAPEFDND